MRSLCAAGLCGFCLTASAYGGEGQAPADGPGGIIAVFDSHGTYVGPVVSFVDQNTATVISANGAIITVPVSRAPSGTHLSATQFEWTSSAPSIEYATVDCSGPPIVSSTSITGAGDAAPVRPSLTIRTGAQTVAYIAPDTYSSTLQNTSQIETIGGCATFPSSTPIAGWFPASTYQVGQNYPEPLSIRISDHEGNGTSRDSRDQAVLKVFDGKGRYVGPLVAAGGDEVATVIVANHATVVVPISRAYVNNEFSATQYVWGISLGSTPYYATSDCSGPLFISGATPVRPSVVFRGTTSATLYIASDADSSTVTVQSYGQPGSCTTLGANSSVPPPMTAEGWAPESTYPLTQHYPEPLSVHY